MERRGLEGLVVAGEEGVADRGEVPVEGHGDRAGRAGSGAGRGGYAVVEELERSAEVGEVGVGGGFGLGAVEVVQDGIGVVLFADAVQGGREGGEVLAEPVEPGAGPGVGEDRMGGVAEAVDVAGDLAALGDGGGDGNEVGAGEGDEDEPGTRCDGVASCQMPAPGR